MDVTKRMKLIGIINKIERNRGYSRKIGTVNKLKLIQKR